MKFKAPIEVESSLVDSSNSSGSAGQVLTSTGVGVDWIDPTLLPAESAEKVIQTVRLGEAVSKGDPLVVTGYHGSTGPAIVERADATDATKMPAYGVAIEDYANNATGLMIAVGDFDDFDTSSYSVGDTLYVAVGGGMTNVKPTGTALIQNMGIVSRSNANNGQAEIVAIGRTNDVPNLPTGRLFVGTATNTSLISDVVYVDDVNDRVGIGTTSPNAKLDVSGNIKTTAGGAWATSSGGVQLTYDGAAGYLTTYYDSNSLVLGAGVTQKTGIYINGQSAATNDIKFKVGNSTRVTFDSNGNVGIGTTSPTRALDVSKSGSTILANFKNTGGTSSFISLGNTSSTADQIRLGSNGTALTLSTNYAERMRINSSGNVGIGTTSPQEELHIASTVPVIRLEDTDGGYAQIVGSNGSLSLRSDQANTVASSIIDFTIDNSEKMRINSSGNVGIGTTSPSYKLDVSGDGRFGGTTTSANTGLTVRARSGDLGDIRIRFDAAGTLQRSYISDYYTGEASNIGFERNNSTGTGIITFDTSNSSFNPSERMRIDSSGNVGIGTTSPSTKLHVLGTTSGVPATGAAPSAAQFGYSTYGTLFSTLSSGRGVIQQGRSDGTATSYDLLLNPRGGNVGIGVGTSVPAYTLDVYGTGRFTGDLRCLSLIQTSQRDQKKDIADIDKSKAVRIPFKEYKYKSSIDGSERKRYGVVVEDIENDYPELVHIGTDGIKGINYIDLLVKRVAELEKELEDISLTPGPKGATGSQGPAGANGRDGANGNDHLKNVQSIAFNEKSGQLEITIEGYKDPFRFNPAK